MNLTSDTCPDGADMRMIVELVWGHQLAEYRFGAGHPMRPERFTLAVELARAWGVLGHVRVVEPRSATGDELALVHTGAYIDRVKYLSDHPGEADGSFGLGLGDTPAFSGVHDAASRVTGATIEALEAVISGRATRSFNPAGGMHHAHRDHASGFCVYNDCAVAIECAIRAHEGLRVAYVDIDAHHGDGVEAVFFDRGDVLTASVHESGRYLFPGTGSRTHDGSGPGAGLAVNVPLEPYAGDAEYLEALEEVVCPAVREFAPDVILAQLGADSHEGDPLTHLGVTVPGFIACVHRLVDLADDVCAGRLAATGGGGYQPFTAVPVMWARALAVIADAPVPDDMPAGWDEVVERARNSVGGENA